MENLSNTYISKGLLGHYVRTFRAPKTEIVYIRHFNGTFTVVEMPEGLHNELNASVQLRTLKKYLPILFIEKQDKTIRVFRHPDKTLFKNNNLNFIGR